MSEMTESGVGTIQLTFSPADFASEINENTPPPPHNQKSRVQKSNLFASSKGKGSLESIFIPRGRWGEKKFSSKTAERGTNDVSEADNFRGANTQNNFSTATAVSGSGNSTGKKDENTDKHNNIVVCACSNSVSYQSKYGRLKSLLSKKTATLKTFATTFSDATPLKPTAQHGKFPPKKQKILHIAKQKALTHLTSLMMNSSSTSRLIKNYDKNTSALSISAALPPLTIFLLDTLIYRDIFDIFATKQIIVLEFYISKQTRTAEPVITVDP